MTGKDLLAITDLDAEDIYRLIRDAVELKEEGWLNMLRGRTLAIMFEKPSLRTRLSFELAMRQLGGEAIYLSPAEVGLGKRESVADVARVISRYASAIAARTFAHGTLEELAEHSSIPVINSLSDREHPCQALADLLTIYEKKGFDRVTLAYVGDGNNVINSLLLAAALVGLNVRIATPDGYQVADEIMKTTREYAQESGSEITLTTDPKAAVVDADVVYTDVWISMGEENIAAEKSRAFIGYTVDEDLLALARDDAILMHPLPAHRGQEITDGALDGPQSVVFDQGREPAAHSEGRAGDPAGRTGNDAARISIGR